MELSDAEGAIPPSPCIGVCRMDADNICLGCGRSGEEIRRYGERVMAARRAAAEQNVQTHSGADERP